MDGLAVRYVHSQLNLAEIEKFHQTIADTHATFSANRSWTDWWDHWLDQHIG